MLRRLLTSPTFKGFAGATAAILVAFVLYLAYVHLEQHAAMWQWITAREAERQQVQRAQTPPPGAVGGS